VVSVDGGEEHIQTLRRLLTLPVANAYFARKYRRGWDGSIKFFGQQSKRFPYGLWPNVKYYLKKNGIAYKAYTSRESLKSLDNARLGDIKLYDYQIQAVNSWLKNGGTGVIWGPAGFGKTEISAAIIKQMLKRKLVSRILFIVNGLDLLEQATDRLHLRLGLKIGKISGGGVDLSRIVTVAAIQKLHGLIKNKDGHVLKFLSEVDLLVIDEVHHGRSDQTSMLIRNCDAKYRLGVSARPLRISHEVYETKNLQSMKADDARVLAAMGPIVIRIKPSQLIEINRLAKPRIYMYPLNYKEWRQGSSLENMDWQEAKNQLIVKNSVIHSVTKKQVLAAAKAGQATLVIAGGSKQLGMNIYRELQDANLNAVYLHGSINKDFRNKSRIRMTKNRLEAIVATTIYDEGIDIPNLRQLILAY